MEFGAEKEGKYDSNQFLTREKVMHGAGKLPFYEGLEVFVLMLEAGQISVGMLVVKSPGEWSQADDSTLDSSLHYSCHQNRCFHRCDHDSLPWGAGVACKSEPKERLKSALSR